MSGTVFNPNQPATAGLEWFPTRQLRKNLSSGAGVGAIVASTASETIAHLFAEVACSVPFQQALVGVDIYDTASPVFAANDVVGALTLPTENAGNSAGFTEATSGVEIAYDSTGHNYVDVASTEDAAGLLNPLSSTTRVHFEPTGGILQGHVNYRYGTSYTDVTGNGATVTPSGKRIGYLEVVVVAHGGGGATATIDGTLLIGGTQYGSPTGPVAVAAGIFARYKWRWYFDPSTGLQWTPADLAQFQTSGAGGAGVNIVASSPADVAMSAVNFVIRYLPERRVACGYAAADSTFSWKDFPMLDPTTNGTANWSKVSGHSYEFVFYTSPLLAAGSIVGVDSANLADHELDQLTGWEGIVQPTVSPILPSAIVAFSSWVPSMFLVTSAPAIGVDAQPYVSPQVLVVTAAGVDKQGVATHGTASYGMASFVAGQISGIVPDAPLIVRIRKVSDDSQVGGDISVDPSEIVADGKFHLIKRRFASAASLVSGTAYYVRFTTAATNNGWQVVGTYTRDAATGTTANDTTAAGGSIAGAGTLNGTSDATLDWLLNLGTVPSAPGTLASSQLNIANRPVLTGNGAKSPDAKFPTKIYYAHLTWAATSLTTTFGYYEIQRQIGSVWYTIETITLEASNYYNDFTGPRSVAGVARSYRIRVVRADGAFSDWATFPSVSIHVDDALDIVLATNVDPDTSLTFKDMTDGAHTWDQLRTGRIKVQPIMGVDYPVTFVPAEQGGEAFVRKLGIAVSDPAIVDGGSVTPDRTVFAPALALLQDPTLPYLSYSDGWGNEWLVSAAVQSPGPAREEPGGIYTIPVLFTQVAAVPLALSDATPPVP